MNHRTYRPDNALDAFIVVLDTIADESYDAMLRATSYPEAVAYEARYARHVNLSAVARAEQEGL